MTSKEPLPIICVAEDAPLAGLTARQARWAEASGFRGQLGRLLALPSEEGDVAGYLFGTGVARDRPPLFCGLASAALEPGRYRLVGGIDDPTLAALGFRLGAYRFDAYRKPRDPVELEMPPDADAAEVERLTEAAFLARDLVNTPANDLGPAAFEARIREFAAGHHMSLVSIVGDDLLAEGFPMIHAVGRAAAEPPRLVELNWGNPKHPLVILVGKGVTFDTGGLDIKPSAGMLLMKKDMGGAANILGLAGAIVDAGLKLRLRVLIPIVENAIAAASFRPGDILRARSGVTVEIGNTDAEGRLILADALTYADEADPALVIDFATLTGAARTALGPDLPPLYTDNDALAADLLEAGVAGDDPLWRLPLWRPYQSMLASKVADIDNAGTGGFAGSITAALFLSRFVRDTTPWAHLDIYAWAPEAKAGRSQGGTDQGIRAIYGMLKKRYS